MILNDKEQNEQLINFYSSKEGLYNPNYTEDLFRDMQKMNYVFSTCRYNNPGFDKTIDYDYMGQADMFL